MTGIDGYVNIYTRNENGKWMSELYDIDSPFFPDDFRGVIYKNHKQNLTYQMPDDAYNDMFGTTEKPETMK